MAGEIEIVAGVVVAGGESRIGDAMDEGQMMPLPRGEGEVFADRKPRGRRGDGAF